MGYFIGVSNENRRGLGERVFDCTVTCDVVTRKSPNPTQKEDLEGKISVDSSTELF